MCVCGTDSRSGSALLIVLGVMAVLSLLVVEFGRGLRGDLRASGVAYEEAQNRQLALSALAAARMEFGRTGVSMVADPTGNVFFVTSDSFDGEIEELSVYRQGVGLGRGMLSYRFLVKPNAVDINDLGNGALGRLFEVACGLEEGEERSALTDAVLDWIDADSMPRAYGAEEDFYLQLDLPRHCRNAPFDTVEEILLVNGMTPDLLFGYTHPVRIEEGMLLGGGLYRYLIGDNSPEAKASVQYIRRGVRPVTESRFARNEEEPAGFSKVTELPEILYLIAEGFVPAPEDDGHGAGDVPPVPVSRFSVLVKLVLPENARGMDYQVADVQENAAGELLERVLACGVSEAQDEF